jgi:general secretion pathway protein K
LTTRGAHCGAAVVLAMLLAAFAAVVAATVLAQQQRWARSVELRRDQVQAQTIAMAAVQWARQVLDQDARSTRIDHLGEAWALDLPPIPLENGEVRGRIVDAQGRLNVNDLGDSGSNATLALTRFRRLFATVHADVATLDAIADWIDADSTARPNGAEDGWYAAQSVPTLAANAPVLRVAELAGVRGLDPESLAPLLPFVAALPARTAVNVNTAPPEVLAALFEQAPRDALEALVTARKTRPFQSIGDLRSRLPDGMLLATDEGLDVKSRFFLVSVEARQGRTVARARALVRRDAEGWPAIVWQVIE